MKPAHPFLHFALLSITPFLSHPGVGIVMDSKSNVYYATETVVRGQADRTPSGGLVAPNGDLWLLEYGGISSVRVRRIDRQGKSKNLDKIPNSNLQIPIPIFLWRKVEELSILGTPRGSYLHLVWRTYEESAEVDRNYSGGRFPRYAGGPAGTVQSPRG